MKIKFRKYHTSDFNSIRNFLNLYSHKHESFHSQIFKFELSLSYLRIMNGISIEEWESKIGIWENEGEIEALVFSDDEKMEKALLLFYRKPSQELITETLIFIEKNYHKTNKRSKNIYLSIPTFSDECSALLKNFDYEYSDWNVLKSCLTFSKTYPNIPEEFKIVSGEKISLIDKSGAYLDAFGCQISNLSKKNKAFKFMKKMPNYCFYLDLFLLNQNNKIVAFCSFWHNTVNQTSYLKKISAIKKYKNMGLEELIFNENRNRANKIGIKKIFIECDSNEYVDMGFNIESRTPIYKKCCNYSGTKK